MYYNDRGQIVTESGYVYYPEKVVEQHATGYTVYKGFDVNRYEYSGGGYHLAGVGCGRPMNLTEEEEEFFYGIPYVSFQKAFVNMLHRIYTSITEKDCSRVVGWFLQWCDFNNCDKRVRSYVNRFSYVDFAHMKYDDEVVKEVYKLLSKEIEEEWESKITLRDVLRLMYHFAYYVGTTFEDIIYLVERQKVQKQISFYRGRYEGYKREEYLTEVRGWLNS